MTHSIVITGSPCHHFRFFGPFNSHEAATDWAKKYAPAGEPYWVQPLINAVDHRSHLNANMIVTGNIVDGLTYYGPFTTEKDAMSWARKNIQDREFLHERLTHVKEPT